VQARLGAANAGAFDLNCACASWVTGLDIAQDMLRLCREAAAAAGLAERCEFVRSDLLQLSTGVAFDVTLAAVDVTPASDDVARVLVRRSELRQLRLAILSLPSRYREVIVLCDLEDVSYADTAATVGCAVGTVRSRLHRARHLLAEKMRRSTGSATRSSGSMERCAV